MSPYAQDLASMENDGAPQTPAESAPEEEGGAEGIDATDVVEDIAGGVKSRFRLDPGLANDIVRYVLKRVLESD